MFTRFRATLAAGLLAATFVIAPATASTPERDLNQLQQAVNAAVTKHTGKSYGQADVQRQEKGWAFGVAILRAAPRLRDYPQGWLFLATKAATKDGRKWTVALDSGDGFSDLASRAPESVFSKQEKQTFATRDVSIQALSSNTGLRLPFALGATWSMPGGPHGWGGYETPYSALDLAGGDGIVRAAGAGTVYTMCADSSGGAPGGWRRVYHSSGYTTDYYHLSYLTSLTPGSTIGEGTSLGNIGKNVCAGGSALGAHVHWAILTGTTRVAWHWRTAGKWVFWQGAAYGGYALHGSTQRNAGGALYNYGALGANQGIVDTNGGGTVNRRSGPGTGYPVVGTLADGATVTISCWRNGTSHTGRWGATSVWNKLTDGTWFSDAFAYTGANTIGPSC